MKNNSLFIALIFGLTLSIVQGAIGSESYTQFCPAQGTLSFITTDQTSQKQFGWIGTYYESTTSKESIPLLFKAGDASNPYSFITYDNKGVPTASVPCPDTKGYDPINVNVPVINEFLFLKSGGQYYVCKYTPTAIQKTKLNSSGIVTKLGAALENFVPYLVNGDDIYVQGSSSAQSLIAKFTWASGGTALTPVKVGTDLSTTKFSPDNVIGTDVALFDRTTRAFMKQKGDSSFESLASPAALLATDIVTGYTLRAKTVIVTVEIPDKTSGSVWLFTTSGIANQGASGATSTPALQSFTDNVNNYVRVSSEQLLWITLASGDGASSKTSTASKGDLSSSDLTKVANVGLSQNKAVILYTNNVMQFYKHTPAGIVKLFSKEPSIKIDTTLTKQYTIVLSCKCKAIKRFTCFAQTLNCVIIQKAGDACAGTTGDKNVKSWDWGA